MSSSFSFISKTSSLVMVYNKVNFNLIMEKYFYFTITRLKLITISKQTSCGNCSNPHSTALTLTPVCFRNCGSTKLMWKKISIILQEGVRSMLLT